LVEVPATADFVVLGLGVPDVEFELFVQASSAEIAMTVRTTATLRMQGLCPTISEESSVATLLASPPVFTRSRSARHSAASWSAAETLFTRSFQGAGLGFYPQWMLDLDGIDVEEIATALADQTDYEHRWLIDPRTGQVAFWTSDTGIDGENPVEIDELDLILIDPLPPYVWFQDMADFADGISDGAASQRLTQSLQGRGAFRRFKNELYQHHPSLISAWHALRDVRAQRRAVEWLLDQGLIDDSAAQQFATDHPNPGLP
jgi:hypothetical protein